MPRRPDMPPFSERDLLADPFDLFAAWYELAREETPLAEAMCLATVDEDGMPDARMVLLKGFDAEGFTFFTNRESRKGQDLAANPRAALLFWWDRLHRQVRIEGPVERISDAESDAYFHSRPYGRADRRLGEPAEPAARAGRGKRSSAGSRKGEERFGDGEVPRLSIGAATWSSRSGSSSLA